MAEYGRLDWAEYGEHVRTRPQRQPSATSIETEWADEAFADPLAVWYEPDPASKSGKTIRVVGYSSAADMVLVVIVLRERDGWTGINAWRANLSYQRRYWERP